MRVLFIGDVVGKAGRTALEEILADIAPGYDLIIANGENAAGGAGITPPIAENLFQFGVDLITTGNHIWNKKEILGYIDETPRLLRPMNYPKGTPGRGWGIFQTDSGVVFCLINLMGRIFMEPLDNPFIAVTDLLGEIDEGVRVIIVDFHAEATSEKIAMGWHLDGKVSAVIGTHTHVQTADERVLPEGTAYITDVGMTGAHDSVIGVRKESVLYRFATMMPTRFDVAKGNVLLCGVEVDVDEKTGKSSRIERLRLPIAGDESS
jgi:metallophosphoesterase (TIGR00282 family)